MKKRRVYLLALLAGLVVLLCMACTVQRTGETQGYLLYFTVADQISHGAALDTQPWQPATEQEIPDPATLLHALLAGPSREGLSSPFPRGVTLQGWSWDEEQEGKLQIRMSEPYSGLADISLTLADYCIVLTLSQLAGVESVEILSQGYTGNYRSHQTLTAQEALLTRGGAMEQGLTN